MSFFLPFVHTFFFLVIPGATALMIRRSSTKRRRYHGAIYDLNLQGGVCFMDDMSFFSLFLTLFPCCAGIYLFHFFWYISIRNFVYIWQSQSCIMTCPLYPSCLPPFFSFSSTCVGLDIFRICTIWHIPPLYETLPREFEQEKSKETSSPLFSSHHHHYYVQGRQQICVVCKYTVFMYIILIPT